ncbi:MAG: hypothetical protein WDN08_05695 [Rhizomicrobium sp.]
MAGADEQQFPIERAVGLGVLQHRPAESDRSAQGDIATQPAGIGRLALRAAVQHREGEAAAGAVARQHDLLRRDIARDEMAIGVDAVAHRGGETNSGPGDS